MSTPEECKEAGNKAFAAKEFETAIKHYSKAIQLDQKNHVFFSNRSASYAGLSKWEEAVSDAKDCIRLEPTFIKGYYRLVVASIGNDDLEGALAAAKQGLNVDPTNAQLLKQKAIVKAKKDTKAAALAASARMVSQNAVAAGSDKELMDLSNQLRTSMRDYNIVNAKISNEEKTLKMAQLTKKEMDELPKDNTKMYRGVGKMFMASSRDEVHTHLANEMKSSDAAITDLGQKRDYLEKRIKSTQQNMKELTKQ